MSKVKKIAIVAIFLIVIGAVGSFITFQSMGQSSSVNEERVIDSTNFTDIEVSADNQQVEIFPTDDSKAKVELEGRSSKDIAEKLSVEVKGNKLSIKIKDKHTFNFFNFTASQLTLRVYLPKKTYDSLQVDIDNGALLAEQLNVKNIHAETSNGTLELKDMEATALRVESDNGEIELENVTGEIQGETDNGEITLVTPNLNRPITLDSDNGRITIETDKEPTNVTFDVQVDNGDVTIFDKYNGNAVFGNGENRIKLSTDNGDITVSK
ncbi:DUF4097 family beta strand repeat-containing protein [Virgibacillus flavescens]|uniref:DUF4097 family beta strand repeat-containing protein n=1 Tax=Virgibacillus flavescens TaxID=1611422 RepID=UPI003D33DF8F